MNFTNIYVFLMFDFCNLRVRQKTLSQNRILAGGNKCSPFPSARVNICCSPLKFDKKIRKNPKSSGLFEMAYR